MVIRPKEHWFLMLFIWRGSVLPKVLPRLLLLFVFSIGIVFVKGYVYHFKITLNPTPFTLFGIALAVFLGFRNNASYDRFWEGRKLWGALLNDTRSLARQAITLSGYPQGAPEVREFIRGLSALTYALNHQLRHTDPSKDMQRLVPSDLARRLESVTYKPIILMRELGLWVRRAKAEGRLDSIVQVSFDENLGRISDIIGGCERIAGTPIPYTYNVLLHRTVYIYCFLLPFGFVDSLGWMMPIISVFIAYTFVALEAVAEEIEEPFGTEPNDLALNAMSKMIETTLFEMIDERTEPADPAGDPFIID